MDSIIRPAVKEDIPALCEIWKQCFPDSDDYIKLFYKNNFERIKILAFYADGKPVSMLHLIDAELKDGNEIQAAKFIYATGTLPEYRRKGCMGALIKQITADADKGGYALFLKPASPATAEYYKRFGFEKTAFLNLVTLTPNEKQPLTVFDLTYEKYNRMREDAFCGVSHIKWDGAHIKWCIEENEYFSGKTLGIKYKNKDYFLLGYPERGSLIINETDLSLNELSEISGSLCGIFGTERIKAYMPDHCEEGEKITSSLLYNTNTNNPYINMIMI